MKNPALNLLASASLLMGAVSCTTIITARKASTTTTRPGIRYYLPQPFLLMTPGSAGMSKEIVYIPDRDAEYTIDITYLMSSGSPKIMRDALGMLKAVTFDMNNDAVAKELLDKTGQVSEDAIKAFGAQKKADQNVEALVFKKQAAVSQAELKLEQAKRALAAAPEEGKVAAQAAVDAAQVELESARLNVQLTQEGARKGFTAEQLGLANFGDKPENTATVGQYLQQPGSILYRIVQTKNSVSLERVMGQKSVRTVLATPAPPADKLPAAGPVFTLKTSKDVEVGGILVLTAKTASPPKIKAASLYGPNNEKLKVAGDAPKVETPAGGGVTIKLPGNLEKGAKYVVAIIWADDDKPAEKHTFETAK